MLLRCCLIYVTIIIPRHNLDLVCLWPHLSLGLFMLYICNLLFIFSLIFIVINHITSFKQKYLFFVQFLEFFLLFLDNNVDRESQQFSNNKTFSRCCLAFAWFFTNFSVALLINVFIKKACYLFTFLLRRADIFKKSFINFMVVGSNEVVVRTFWFIKKENLVQVFGTGVWYRWLVQVFGTGVWYRCLVQVFGTGVWYRCFPVNFVKFLWSLFFAAHLRWLLLFINSFGSFRMYIITFATYCSLLFRRCSH